MKRQHKTSCLATVLVLFMTLPLLWANERIDKVQYEIQVELDHEKHMLYGKETITWFNDTRDRVSDIWLHLYWNAFKNEKSAMAEEDRESKFSLGGRFSSVEDGDWGWIDVKNIRLADGTDLTSAVEFVTPDEPVRPDDQTVMRVNLPRPVRPGGSITLKLEFDAKVPTSRVRAGYYQNGYFISQWFPKPGVYEEGKGWNCHQYHMSSEFFANFAEFKVHITVPKDFVIGASGKEIAREENEENGTVTYTHWQNHIHDFAWTADPDYMKIERDFIADEEITPEEYEEASEILQLPIDKVRMNDTKMILLIHPEHKGQIDRHFNALKAALKYYGLWYGPYPYETITLVDPPIRTGSGGMEYPTLFTAGTRILKSKQVHSPEGVIIHEFGHGYWYGMCANNEFEEAWLDEGINSYSTGKALNSAYGPGALPIGIARIPLTRYFDAIKYYDYELDRTLGMFITQFDPIVTYSWKFYDFASYGLNVYMRASASLYTLENIVGEDVMLRILRTFQMRFRYKHPVTQDFIDVVNEVSGRNMTWFFDEFFYRANEFDYGVASVMSKKIKTARGVFDKDGEHIEITRKTAKDTDKEVEDPPYLSIVRVRRYGEAKVGGDVKLKVNVVFEDGSTETEYWDGQARWTEFRYTRPSKIKYVHADPENIFLIDANMTNNSLRRKPSHTGTLRWSSKFLFWIQNLMQFASIFS
jgi:hypothetical protein